MKKFLLLCLLLPSTALASIHYGDCVNFSDDFYGTGHGLVVAHEKTIYQVFVSAFLTLRLEESQLQVVDHKFCEER